MREVREASSSKAPGVTQLISFPNKLRLFRLFRPLKIYMSLKLLLGIYFTLNIALFTVRIEFSARRLKRGETVEIGSKLGRKNSQTQDSNKKKNPLDQNLR